MRCNHWAPVGTSRCEAPAVARLYAPDGKANPGGWYCGAHATAITTEYADILGERWTTRPLDGASLSPQPATLRVAEGA